MKNPILYIALTIASLFLVMHLVARIQIARAALLSDQDRKKGARISNLGIIEGAVCVGLFAFMLTRDFGGPLGVIVTVVLAGWLVLGCYRMTRMLILMQSVMQLRKRTAKGGGMNSGALAGIVSVAAGLIALVWAFIASQPTDQAWEDFKAAHDCKPVEARSDAQAGSQQTAWVCSDGVTYHR